MLVKFHATLKKILLFRLLLRYFRNLSLLIIFINEEGKMAKIGVLLSGCGVFDGSEIHESVLTLLYLNQAGAEILCMAPDMDQHHVMFSLLLCTESYLKEKNS